MQSFYQFMMTFRGKLKNDSESELAEWMFTDHDFPKHAVSYDEVSDYLEWNSPFPEALKVFDKLWNIYTTI
ncbi:YozE family protein [Virgibacillus sp. W0181]|uniref:YozE family protein n=1 Tax=Virgibacillus sp. W0181 TaxID=3391581 RepID=UPI003F450FCB